MVIVGAIRRDCINDETDLLRRSLAMCELAGDLVGSVFERAVETESLRVCEALSVVFAIPHYGRTEDLLCALYNPDVFGADGRSYSGISLLLR
jgi:hypothetical protein